MHSEGAESIVVLQRSRLTVSGLSRCGDSAVAVLGGHLISRDSIFKGEVDTPEVIVLAGTESERNHATVRGDTTIIGLYISNLYYSPLLLCFSRQFCLFRDETVSES